VPPPSQELINKIVPVWRNWQTRTTQNRVEESVSVRPRPPVLPNSVRTLLNQRFDLNWLNRFLLYLHTIF
jgi:hypothetical protein